MLKFRLPELQRLLGNAHFWIVGVITIAVAVIYYEFYHRYNWFWQFSVFEFRLNIIGSLFIIPFLYASLVFWWRGSLIVWSLSMAAILPRMIYYSFTFGALVRNIAFAFVPLATVAAVTLELQWRDRQRQVSVEREKERQLYMSQIFKAQEDERRRIAQELHDDTMQELLVIANRAQTLVSGDGNETTLEMRERAEWIRDAILQVLENIRRLSLDLRPSMLDNIGLLPALRWLVDRLNQEGEIDTKVVVHGVRKKLRPETEVTIFRIVQEALNNVRRHSKATKAMVTLKFNSESLEIMVQDNGEGFPLNETIRNLTSEGKLGLIGMQQRAQLINSTFNIYSRPGEGTLVSIKIPV